jgi:hypothetical protein
MHESETLLSDRRNMTEQAFVSKWWLTKQQKEETNDNLFIFLAFE